MAKERLRFSVMDDLILLREVITQNPFDYPTAWRNVRENVANLTGKQYSMRTVKEHTEHLLKLWSKEDRGKIRKSATQEQYIEKEQLLQKINDLYKYKSRKRPATHHAETQEEVETVNLQTEVDLDLEVKTEITTDDEINDGTVSEPEVTVSNDTISAVVREELISMLSPIITHASTSTILGEKRKHENTKMTVSNIYSIRDKSDKDQTLKTQELSLEERRLELEEKKLRLEEEKFQLEKKERESHLMVEIEERRHRMAMAEQQQKIIEFLLKNASSK